jgi:hypothetical protein
VQPPADPDRLLARAIADLERGEPWRARSRLRQYLATQPFDPRFARALGELELAHGELPEAGRWLWLAHSDAPAHAAVVDRHLRNHGKRDGQRLWATLPRSLRRGIGDRPLPGHVADALRARGFDPARQRPAARGHDDGRSPAARALRRWLGHAGCLLFLAVLVLGVAELIRLIRALLGF